MLHYVFSELLKVGSGLIVTVSRDWETPYSPSFQELLVSFIFFLLLVD